MREWLWPPGVVGKVVALFAVCATCAAAFSLIERQWGAALAFTAFAALVLGMAFLSARTLRSPDA